MHYLIKRHVVETLLLQKSSLHHISKNYPEIRRFSFIAPTWPKISAPNI